MKVKELIEQLQKMPQDQDVIVYSALGEDWGCVDFINVVSDKKEFPYCGGDKPGTGCYPCVVIGGEAHYYEDDGLPTGKYE